MNSITATPASGRNTATVSAQLLSVRGVMRVRWLLDDDHEDEGGDAGRGEEQGAVLLDLAGLHGAQPRARLLGDEAGAVHGPVDEGLVDVAVHPATDQLAPDPRPVDDPVDDLLVEPVAAPGDRAA